MGILTVCALAVGTWVIGRMVNAATKVADSCKISALAGKTATRLLIAIAANTTGNRAARVKPDNALNFI